jgi:hypothetical protein
MPNRVAGLAQRDVFLERVTAATDSVRRGDYTLKALLRYTMST